MSLEKYVIVFDTVCDGWQAVMDGEDNPALFDSKEEAEKEVMDDFQELQRHQLLRLRREFCPRQGCGSGWRCLL